MSSPVTVPTPADARAFVDAVEHPTRRADGLVLLDLFAEATGCEPVMWGPSIVGFGSYHYRYESGREGDSLAVGFSPRKANLALYGLANEAAAEEMLARLGKHKRGASCVYVNKLADVDVAVLRELIVRGFTHMRTRVHQP
ncbi:DUF1801 domain-containing protein [Zhihengliuella flava]|uniref:YdhG-like domain-containing protein n=1 Tax=Zhihengliuella flava TaxID=1285193 RepID=A0A931DAX7_9MICC|nr:DUF1801 domain-containing protein [Zhihengliuella flava]MBG6084056.1 hypothetical protein [Zhihengliuella flava]